MGTIISALLLISVNVYSQSQLHLEIEKIILSDFSSFENINYCYSQSDNMIIYYNSGDNGVIDVEEFSNSGENEIVDKKVFKLINDENEPYCYSLSAWNNYYYVLGQDNLLRYLLNEDKNTISIDSFNYTKQIGKYPNFNKMLPLDSNRVLLMDESPDEVNNRAIKFEVFDFTKNEIIRKSNINVGKNLFLKYESVINYTDCGYGNIFSIVPGTNMVLKFDYDLTLLDTFYIPMMLETSVSDSINKYISDSLANNYFYYPKVFIEIMSKSKGYNIFGLQQLRSINVYNDSVLVVCINNEKMDFHRENQYIFLNHKTGEIINTIEANPIDYWTDNYQAVYQVGIYTDNAEFVVVTQEIFNDTLFKIDAKYNIYKRTSLNNIKDNSILLDSKTYFLYDFKNIAIKVNPSEFDAYMFFDEYNCKSCIKDKSIKIIFIAQKYDKLSNYKTKQAYSKEYPNSIVVFMDFKFHALSKDNMNRVNYLR